MSITARLSTALADRYKIERHLGEGGMATVYLAHDLKHDRKVAVKVLRPELSAILGGERFLNEIKVTANLQHPNILPLYDSGEADSFLYYVMPFMEGESLRDKLDREKQLGVEETLEIAKSVAAALEYAHEHDVVHRDIKPENILLQSGQALVADFGIALAVSQAGGTRLTETGLSLGTPHYMSPEQATGDRELDARSDIYSLGAMVYEMLAGEPPHHGNTVQAIIARILSDEPEPLTKHRPSVPVHVDAAIHKALDKTPADRFASAAKFAEALTDASFTLPATAGTAVPSVAVSGPWNRLSIASTALATMLLIMAVWGWLRPQAQPVTRQQVVLWDGDVDVGTNAVRYGTAIAPDGSGIVYTDVVGDAEQLVFKPRDQTGVVPLAGTEGGSGPFFSPDGSWIGFMAEGNLRKVPVGGGASLTLADSVQVNRPSGAWLEDGTIFYISVGWNLKRVDEAGGEAEMVVRAADIGRFVVDVSPLPDARGVLFSACTSNCTESDVYVYDAAADTVRMLFEEAQGVWYVPTGHVLYASRRGGVFAAPFDLGDLAVTGGAVPALEGVLAPNLAVSPDGAVLYRIGEAAFAPNMAEAVWVDRSGGATLIDPDWTFDAGGGNRGWTLSPDQTRMALRMRTDAGFDIWVKELPRGPLSRLTFYEGDDRKAQWSPDGESVLFISNRGGDYDLWVRRADGTGEAELVVDDDGFIAFATGTSDGEWLVLRTGGAAGVEGARDVLVFRPGVDSLPTPLLSSPYDEWAPALSPDGRWLAYASTETGELEVFVRPFPEVEEGKWQISTAGGINPMWSHSGTELFYVSSAGEMMVAQVETRTTFRVGERRPLFRLGDEYIMSDGASYYDVAADDQRFLMVRQAGVDDEEEPEAPKYILVYNWFEELKERVGRE